MKAESYLEYHKKVFISRKEISELMGIKNQRKLTEIMNEARRQSEKDNLVKPVKGKVYKKYILKMIGMEEQK